MISPRDRVLVAVSGGPDSVCLLHLLRDAGESHGFTVAAAHFNHGLRGAESDADEALVRSLCDTLGIAFFTERAGEGAIPQSNREANARRLRYEFLRRTASTSGMTRIATGHTRDDQAETVLLRLIRGAGTTGLGAIPPVRGRIIRPLLSSSRQSVQAYLSQNSLPFRQDSSNDDLRFSRNVVRHRILPLLREMNPTVDRRLAETAAIAARDARVLASLTRRALRRAVDPDGNLFVPKVRGLPDDLRTSVIRAWVGKSRGNLTGIHASHLDSALLLVEGARVHGSVSLPGGWMIQRDYDLMRLDRAPGTVEVAADPHSARGVHQVGKWRIDCTVLSAPVVGEVVADADTFLGDADRLQGEVVIRNAAPGDRIVPFGMTGHKKIQDVFVDRRVSIAERWSRPVVEVGGEIIWIPGVVRGASAPVSTETTRILKMSVVRSSRL